jgi:hypothetical protein
MPQKWKTQNDCCLTLKMYSDISKIENNIRNHINDFEVIDKKGPKDKTETDTCQGRRTEEVKIILATAQGVFLRLFIKCG